MKYTFEEAATIDGNVATVWQTVSDVASWAAWDPHVLSAGFDAPFEAGSRGWTISRLVSKRRGYFTLINVDHERSFTTLSPLPAGKMLITNSCVSAGPGQVVVSRRVEVRGPFAPVFRKVWARAFQADTRVTFGALEDEVRRRSAREGVSR
jgi:hypothetical protein